jgi:hypothetical protein
MLGVVLCSLFSVLCLLWNMDIPFHAVNTLREGGVHNIIYENISLVESLLLLYPSNSETIHV